MPPEESFENCARLGYYPFADYLRRRFGCKVHKVSLDAGFTCPNRDGTIGVGGCTYCVNESFSSQAGRPVRPIADQMVAGMAYMRRRYKAKKFIAYFQAYTNTYDTVERLRERYDEATRFPDVVGLAIGTRPDCVSKEVLDLVESYSDRVEVWLEYGLQTAHDRTLKRINRGIVFLPVRTQRLPLKSSLTRPVRVVACNGHLGGCWSLDWHRLTCSRPFLSPLCLPDSGHAPAPSRSQIDRQGQGQGQYGEEQPRAHTTDDRGRNPECKCVHRRPHLLARLTR